MRLELYSFSASRLRQCATPVAFSTGLRKHECDHWWKIFDKIFCYAFGVTVAVLGTVDG